MREIAPSFHRSGLASILVLLGVAVAPAALIAADVGAEERSLSERIAGQEVAFEHPPLDDPETRKIDKADHMRPDDVVAGLAVGGDFRAYPWWVLKNHHAVNDTLGGEPVLVAFCEQCSAATGFRRTVGDRVLGMETEGVVNGTIILRDRETGTYWAPFDGEGLEGELAGRRLDRLPTFLTTWEDWRQRHPESDVIYAQSSLRQGHGSRESPGKWGVVGLMGETLRTWDIRLAENEFVRGVTEGAESRAYPFRAIERQGGIVVDRIGDRPVVIVARGMFEMAAYDRRLGDRVLDFEPSGDESDRFRDVETGSSWTIEGTAVEGPLAGSRLTPLDGYSGEWHVWSEYHPDSTIFGLEAPSTPGESIFPLTSLPRLVGEKVRSEPLDLDAPLNVVVVWARWCPPCRDKVPLFSRLAAAAPERGYRFRSIAVQLLDTTELSDLKGFIYEQKIDWPIYLFEDAQYAELDSFSREQSGTGLVIPTAFLIDGEGKVLRVLRGAELDELESLVNELSPQA